MNTAKSPLFTFQNTLALAYLFYVSCRVSLHQVVLLPDGAGRTLIILNLLFLSNILLIKKNRILIPSLGWIWFIWCIYAFSNTLIQGLTFEMSPWQFFNHLFTPLISLILTYRLIVSGFARSVLKVLISATVINSILYGFFTGSIFYEGEGERLGSDFVNANTIGQELITSLVFVQLAYYLKSIKLIPYLIVNSFVFFVILQTGSRTGLVVGGSLFLLGLWTNNLFKIRSNYFMLIIFVGLIFASFEILRENFIVFERLSITKEEGETVAQTGTILDFLGGRAIYYVNGFEVFRSNFIFGVGLNNYRRYNPLNDQPNHVEVMVQLSELGFIGSSLFILFFYFLLASVFSMARKNQIKVFLLLSSMLILANCFSFWIYNQQLVFVTIGLICGLVVSDKRKVSYPLLRE